MEVLIKTIDHKDQRYPTVGDWFYTEDGQLFIKVSSMNNKDYEFLVSLHEYIEAYLCFISGVTQSEVDAWDLNHSESDDPGSLEGCPYRIQHNFATYIEKQVADIIGVNWHSYGSAIDSLQEG